MVSDSAEPVKSRRIRMSGCATTQRSFNCGCAPCASSNYVDKAESVASWVTARTGLSSKRFRNLLAVALSHAGIVTATGAEVLRTAM